MARLEKLRAETGRDVPAPVRLNAVLPSTGRRSESGRAIAALTSKRHRRHRSARAAATLATALATARRDQGDDAWWCLPLQQQFAELHASERGLTHREAAARLRRDGSNTFRDEPPRSLVAQLARRFANPLVLILLAASVISGLMGQYTSFVIIVSMVLLSVVLDFFQEHRAGEAAERLRQSVLVRANVWRDGAVHSLAVSKVVRGDIVLLAAGDLVPADGRLIDAKTLRLNQAVLTGEAFPVEKCVQDLPEASCEIALATNAAFMGTAVVGGVGRLLVCRTGADTAIGRIAASIATEPPPTAFERGIRRFGLLIMRLTVFLVLFVLFANVITHKPWLESFLFAVALAVGLTPELLPMIISVTLSRGALHMAARGAIVKRLSAIEDLGAMDVMCTDKTGTLTEAIVRVERHVDIDGRDSTRVLHLAQINSALETGIKTPMDEALLGHQLPDISGWSKLDEIPFDFERRRVSVLVERDHMRTLIVKGAPEAVLALCDQYEAGREVDKEGVTSALCPLDQQSRIKLREQFEAFGKDGLRALAIAYKAVSTSTDSPRLDESQLIFCGFVTFLDPPKASAGHAMQTLAERGVRVKIISGDDELVTRHICHSLNIAIEGLMAGHEVSAMDDLTLMHRAETVNVFCRMNPAEKRRVVEALKQGGHVVGYMGDGINDVPALYVADISLSVDRAVDVAKEAADIILTKPDLGVLHDAVIEGRRTFVNIRKYIMMGTSSNFGNMFSMAGAALFLPFLAMLPTQILLNNILYDLSEMSIPLDQVDDVEIARPLQWDLDFYRRFMLVIGPVSSLFDFATFFILLKVFGANEALFQTAWFMESLATQVLVIFVIRTRFSPLGKTASRPTRALVISSLSIVACAILLPYTPLAAFFGFVAPPAYFLLVLIGLVTAYLVLVYWVNQGFYRYFANGLPKRVDA
jgi:P-type Mg2+ transporter